MGGRPAVTVTALSSMVSVPCARERSGANCNRPAKRVPLWRNSQDTTRPAASNVHEFEDSIAPSSRIWRGGISPCRLGITVTRRTGRADSAVLSLGRRRKGLAPRNSGANGKIAGLLTTSVRGDDIPASLTVVVFSRTDINLRPASRPRADQAADDFLSAAEALADPTALRIPDD